MYDTGLGQTIARAPTTFRDFQTYIATRASTPIAAPKPVAVAPVPAPKPTYTDLIRRVITTTTKPTVAPTTTIKPVVTVKPGGSSLPVLIAGSGTPSGGSTTTSGGGPVEVGTMGTGGSALADLAKAFTNSPMPLIVFGLIALAFADKSGGSRKKGRK